MTDRPKPKPTGTKTRNDARKNGKAFKREGARRNRSVQQSELDKALLGGGVMRRYTRPLDVGKPPTPWVGMASPSNPPYDRSQVEENRLLYPHLFTDR